MRTTMAALSPSGAQPSRPAEEVSVSATVMRSRPSASSAARAAVPKLERVVENTLRVLDVAAAPDIPVAAGAVRPLLAPPRSAGPMSAGATGA